MRGGPIQLILGCLLLAGCIVLIVSWLRGEAPASAAIVGGLVIGPPILGMIGVLAHGALVDHRARRAARALVRLALRAAESGQASPEVWDEARRLAARIKSSWTSWSRENVGEIVMAGLRPGPLRGTCAMIAASGRERDPRLSAAFSDPSGIQSIDEVAAVARWIRDWGEGDRAVAIERLVREAPPEARPKAVQQLVLALGDPDTKGSALLAPHASYLEAVVREEGPLVHPHLERWAKFLKENAP